MTATLEFNPAEKTCNNFPLKSSKNVFTSLRLAKSFRPWLREQEAQRPVQEIVLSCKPFVMQLSLICLMMFLRPLIYTYNYSFSKDNCRGHELMIKQDIIGSRCTLATMEQLKCHICL